MTSQCNIPCGNGKLIKVWSQALLLLLELFYLCLHPPLIVDRPYCTQNITYVSSGLDETATLTCTVNSNPNDNVSISWYFNNRQVTRRQQKIATLPENDYIAYQTISVQARWVDIYLLTVGYCRFMLTGIYISMRKSNIRPNLAILHKSTYQLKSSS